MKHTAASAARAMHEGSEALIWAEQEGIITERMYDEAERPFDAAQNMVYERAQVAATA